MMSDKHEIISEHRKTLDKLITQYTGANWTTQNMVWTEAMGYITKCFNPKTYQHEYGLQLMTYFMNGVKPKKLDERNKKRSEEK